MFLADSKMWTATYCSERSFARGVLNKDSSRSSVKLSTGLSQYWSTSQQGCQSVQSEAQ
jgi:hypothetical protein